MNTSLDLGDVFTRCRQIEARASGERLDHRLEWRELTVRIDLNNPEPTLNVVGVDLLESLEDLWNFTIRQVVCRCKRYPAGQ